MADNAWKPMTLGEFTTLQRGHDLPEERRRTGQIPILGSFGITGWHDEARAAGPGVTVGRSGASFGVVSYSSIPYWPLNTALYVKDFHGNNERFAYYLLKTFDFKRYNSGSAQPSLNRNYIHPIRIDVPPLSEQKAIAHILGTLDDKIELNRRMNETLEAMARATFKSWFVDFDPVRAKMDGRKPAGMDNATAALFPDRFEDSQYGRIPRSWKISTLGDEVDLLTGFPFKSKEYTDSDNSVRLVRGDNIVQSRLRWQNVKRWPVRLLDGLDRYQLVSGDVVLAMDRPWIEAGLKYAWISDHDMPCLLVQRVARLRSREDRIGGSFLRLLIGSPQFTQYVLAIQTGTAVPHISGTQIKSFAFSRPPFNDEALLRRFEDMLEPILEKHDRNEGESQRLSTIRDTLLPKLLSGEIRVSEAEQTVAEVA